MQLMSRNLQFSHRSSSVQRGVSLIEVLIAIVIASIGLLALAGVNASSIRYTKMSQYRGTATLLATDLGERIRANPAGLASYALGLNFAAQAATPAVPTVVCHPTATLTNPYTVQCTPQQLALDDLQTWRVRVQNQLPEGAAYIAIQNAQRAADVWVVWRDPAVASDDLGAASTECPAALSIGTTDKSVRCSYFRFNI
jgi:type IV pilus assembly protein PilV